jgi:hypothetical protein
MIGEYVTDDGLTRMNILENHDFNITRFNMSFQLTGTWVYQVEAGNTLLLQSGDDERYVFTYKDDVLTYENSQTGESWLEKVGIEVGTVFTLAR